MISNKSKQGRKIADRQNPVLSQDVVKLLKTQDAAYLKTMLGKTRRAREKLEQEFVLREGRGADVLGITSDEPKSMHTIFVESKEEQRQYGYSDECVLRSKRSLAPLEAPSSPKVEKAEGADHDIFNKSPQSRRITARRDIDLDREAKLRKKHRKERGARSSKLQALRVREKDLIEAEHNLELQRSKMNNSVGGVTKAGLKWRVRERKK